MFRGKLEHQFHLLILSIGIVFIASFNYLNYQMRLKQHNFFQQELSTIILNELTNNTEYGLYFGEKTSVDELLQIYKDSTEIAYIHVYDSQNNLFSELERRNELNLSVDSPVNHFRAFVKRKPVEISEQDDLFNDQRYASQDTDVTLGEVVLALIPKKYSQFGDKQTLYTNLVLYLSFIIFWLLIYFKHRRNSKNISQTIAAINARETSTHNSNQMISLETRRLYDQVIKQNCANHHYEKQLETIKREVRIAREDGNIELHEFIRFLQLHGLEDYQQELDIFYAAVLQNDDSSKQYLELKKTFKAILTNTSDEAASQQVTIFDSYTGDANKLMLNMAKRLFTQSLQFLTEELVRICKNSEIHINFDVRSALADSNMLRISITSESERFLEAANEQSLFHFNKSRAVEDIHNNIKLIACKHLLQKMEGEFFYFKNELRLEIPVETILLEKNKQLTSSIQPIDKKLDVLVYDSDPIERMVLMGYMDKFAVHADKATTQQVILQKIRRLSFDALFVNSAFFEKPDPYFVKNFISEIENSSVKFKIIVLSNNPSVVESPFFQQCDALYLSKPIELEELRKSLLSL